MTGIKALLFAGLALSFCAARAEAQSREARLVLEPVETPGADEGWLGGRFEVWENRQTRRRRISLKVVVLKARGANPRPDPIFWLAGGPGVGATGSARGLARSPLREDRDIVLVDQRGTGASNPLMVPRPGDPKDLQADLDPIFQAEVFRAALKRLSAKAELSQYTTSVAMDDLDEVRAALGYERVNLIGGSYGTRAAMVYMRRHEGRVRSAILNGVAPVAFKNPLFHARAAQEGFEVLAREVEASPRARAAFGDLRSKLDAVLKRLERAPAKVTVEQPWRSQVTLGREAFAEGLRILMYYMGTNRSVPLLLHKAWLGDYRAFAEAAIRVRRGIRSRLSLGMLMSVTGSEDIPRITAEEIARETAGTFLGDGRVRRQMAVARFWPCQSIPNFGDPVRAKTPTLLLSGSHDPVTPPRWGEEAARHLPNSRHIIAPAAHGVSGAVIQGIIAAFLDRGSVEGLDVSGVERLRLPRLVFPERRWF